MNLLIVGINAKYVHSNLAIRYLYYKVKNICSSKICEFSINDNVINAEKEIMRHKPGIVAVSCYIWNIDYALQLCSDIKKMNKDIKVILGGPEVSYDSVETIKSHSFIDYIVKGEGEKTFCELINHICLGFALPEKGITYRYCNDIIDTPNSDPITFEDIPFPYDENISALDKKIIYYESSRGCPYSCKYCLSGEKGNVRFKNTDDVKKDLLYFDTNNIPLVKFVDRTFNADRKRAIEIWQYIGMLGGKTRFHMEITGELLTDETIDALKNVPSDKLQFEIGVQSTNSDTLGAIDRKCNKSNLFNYIKRLLEETDIHIHLDLIAGLPYEDMESFKNSFNEVISLRPHVLQIGFLKLLKGSLMRSEAESYGILYRDKAPYEIISSRYMTYDDILYLKDLDYVFDRYYNSGSFKNTYDFLLGKFKYPFDLFSHIVDFFKEKSYINTSLSKEALYQILYECFNTFGKDFEMALRKDYIKAVNPGKLPSWCNTDEGFKTSQQVYSFLKNEEVKEKIMPHYHNIPAKEIIKHIRFEKFDTKVIAFDYKTGNEYDVTKYFDI